MAIEKFEVKPCTEIEFACGHGETHGTHFADPSGFLAEEAGLKTRETREGKCGVCSDPNHPLFKKFTEGS